MFVIRERLYADPVVGLRCRMASDHATAVSSLFKFPSADCAVRNLQVMR
jgi:hypothetical protein